MASLRPQLPILQTNHIERPPDFDIALSGDDLVPRVGRDAHLEPIDETIPLELPNERTIKLGATLQHKQCEILTSTLISNTYLFAWFVADLPDVDAQVVAHKLSIYKDAKYVSQKKQKLGEEHRLAAKIEADKLLNAGFIEAAYYTTLLSNVVFVKKANSKWRMCVDYTDLNKTCPRDAYLLPNIDMLGDGGTGNKVLGFLDAYFCYNQIPMATTDMNKTAFITDDANYFYKVMPFGHKNARATYQQLMDKVFSHIMGIEANPEKSNAIIEMRSPNSVKELQRFIGHLTAISRFLPKLFEQTQPIIQPKSSCATTNVNKFFKNTKTL